MQDKTDPATLAAHAARKCSPNFKAVNLPVYRASTVLFDSLQSLESGKAEFTYGRRGTPSSRALEEVIATLEGGARTVLTPSGLSAITTALLATLSAGDHLLMTDSAYGPTRSFCDKMLRRYGVETTYYEPQIGAGIAALFQPNTRAVYCESPGSLTFEIQDVPAIAEAAHAHGASVLMDNTWGTPLHCQPLKLGVDLSIQSVTKYIGGHSDLLMGYVCANDSHAARLVHDHGELGMFSSADDIFLALRGLRSLPTRLPRHQETGLALARWLQTRPEVERVLHPGLQSDPGHAIWRRDFAGACGLFGVVLKPASPAKVEALMNGLELFGIGWSWGGFESLVSPAHLTRTTGSFQAEGPVIRFHAGLEDAADLLADLEQGFDHMAKAE